MQKNQKQHLAGLEWAGTYTIDNIQAQCILSAGAQTHKIPLKLENELFT